MTLEDLIERCGAMEVDLGSYNLRPGDHPAVPGHELHFVSSTTFLDGAFSVRCSCGQLFKPTPPRKP